MRLSGDMLRFDSTDREVYCYSGTVGLGLYGDAEGGNSIGYGADGGLHSDHMEWSSSGYLSKEELVELATHMIARWKEVLEEAQK